MDKFPEAFSRFERVVDTRRVRSFSQLELAFMYWSGENWRGTKRQHEALKIEAEKRGIPFIWEKRRSAVFRRGWRHERVSVRGRLQSRYRDVRTGRFIKKPF